MKTYFKLKPLLRYLPATPMGKVLRSGCCRVLPKSPLPVQDTHGPGSLSLGCQSLPATPSSGESFSREISPSLSRGGVASHCRTDWRYRAQRPSSFLRVGPALLQSSPRDQTTSLLASFSFPILFLSLPLVQEHAYNKSYTQDCLFFGLCSLFLTFPQLPVH